MTASSLVDAFKSKYSGDTAKNIFTMQEWLEACKSDKSLIASAAERMLKAIGEPIIDTLKGDERKVRIFANRRLRVYPTFSNFYGMEDVIEQIVAFFRHAAQGLEESKQILYLLGPMGSSKSSLAERLEELMEKEPIYVLIDPSEKDPELRMSPVFESPLGLFNPEEHGSTLSKEYGIPARTLTSCASPWAIKKLQEFDGDFTKFSVQKIYPSKSRQIGITMVEPGDENNQDISALVGKVDIRKLEDYPQDHPYAYSYSGGLNRTAQGLLNFAEMFKASIKTLNPLLNATQSHEYNGTEAIGALPYGGIILAHSNESEWSQFRNNKTNEAFLDRLYIVKVPYCLRVQEEQDIYRKLLAHSSLSEAPCAPGTLEMLARFCVMTRLKEPDNSTLFSKMRVYDGENIKDEDPKVKPLAEYKSDAGVNEGMTGISTRFAFKILSKTFNQDGDEISANPVHLLYVLEKALEQEQLPKETHERYMDVIKSTLQPKYVDYLGKELRTAFLESYQEFGQTIFNNYVNYADHWIQNIEWIDPDTHEKFDREALEKELQAIEGPARISNVKDFRNEIVGYVLRYQRANDGQYPKWTSYEKIKVVIEAQMFESTEKILPLISFNAKASEEEKKKHDAFVERMIVKGYTEKQTRQLVGWFNQVSKRA